MHSIQKLFAPRDLTQGSPLSGIAMFSVPLLLGNLAQQLYNTVDAIVVGNYVKNGDAALGAVGLSGPIINLLIVLFMGISTGATIVVSQYFGARDRSALSRSVGTTIILTLICSLATALVGAVLSRPLLTLLGTPPDMLEMANQYLFIIMIGLPTGAFYNIMSGVLRGLGDSVGPLLYLLVASLLNIVLDILFVTQLNMTTDGVALATILAQGISAVLCVRRLCKMKNVLDVNRSTLIVDRPIMKRIVQLGLPAGLTQMVFSLSSIIIQSLINSLGDYVVTATTVIMRVDGFAMMPNFTFGIAATTFTGQNVGARRLDRVRQGTKATLTLALTISTILTTCILVFGEQLMRVFTQTNEIVTIGVSMMRVLALGYIAFSVTQTLQGVMRGAGETVIPMWISILVTIIIRMPIAYLWAYLTRNPGGAFPNGDPMCIYGSLLIAWLLGCAMTALVYKQGKWKRRLQWDEPLSPQDADTELNDMAAKPEKDG